MPRKSNQLRLMQERRLEVHEHTYVSGPNANRSPCRKVVHSHADGTRPHQHPDTGPATYTIDKDEWFSKTGLIGGGRKKYTASPSGEQLPIVELEDWQRSFDIIIDEESLERFHRESASPVTGPGLAPAFRMILGHGMTVNNVTASPGRRKARRAP